jgi:hypothetical protein
MRECGLGEQCDRLGEHGQGVDLVDGLDTRNGVRRHGHGADGFLMTLVADVHDAETLAGTYFHFVVNLGDERAHGVDHH